MSDTNPYTQKQDVYEEAFTELYVADTEFEELNLDLTDDQLDKMLIQSLEADRDHWNKKPWNLQETDVKNTDFLFGDQLNDKDYLKTETKIVDNRLFSSTRAILSYATGQLAKPEIIPSKGDNVVVNGARETGTALYQHATDEQVDFKVRAAVMNLISRKRGYLKLRWDENIGLNGDIVTEVCNPEDIIICRYAGYMHNPSKIYHRLRCTIAELCAKFPDSADEINNAYSIRRGVYTQTSRMITYFECWFTYIGGDGRPKEGVCWFIHEKKLILDKMANPNWVYMKSHKKEQEANVMSSPPKPFVSFNYINSGHSFIDETCLIEQAMPLQIALNKRLRQINENADYVNGRWVADKNAFSQEDARNLINKGAKTVAMVDFKKSGANPLQNVAPQALPNYVENTVEDYRMEIDGMMGTPSQFKGDNPQSMNTLGRDMMIKQQAGALQDDLVRSIAMAMEQYYTILLQMMRVNYTDDYWFQVKGGDGKYEFILLNGEKLDSNVKVSIQTDSTLPIDKMSIRNMAMELWSSGQAIDYKTLMEDLGLPNPDIRAERYLKSHIDPINYLKSVQMGQVNTDAESDIQLLILNKQPEERDNYDEDYFNYFNDFMASNRFAKLQQNNIAAAQRITAFLIQTQHVMMQSVNLQDSMQPKVVLDAAGISNAPMPMPIPKTSVRIQGAVDPGQSAQLAGVQPDQASPAQSPIAQQGQQAQQQASPPVPTQ